MGSFYSGMSKHKKKSLMDCLIKQHIKNLPLNIKKPTEFKMVWVSLRSRSLWQEEWMKITETWGKRLFTAAKSVHKIWYSKKVQVSADRAEIPHFSTLFFFFFCIGVLFHEMLRNQELQCAHRQSKFICSTHISNKATQSAFQHKRE